MAISYALIDQQAAQLKKARAVLSLVTDSMPVTDGNDDCLWAVSTVHGIIHDVIDALEAEVSAHLNELRTTGVKS